MTSTRAKTSTSAAAISAATVRAFAAKEFVLNLGGSNSAGESAALGMGERLLKKLVCHMKDDHDVVQREIAYEVDQSIQGDITLDTSSGMSVLEAVSPAFAASVAHMKETAHQFGYRPTFRYHFVDEINADADRRAAAMKHLDLVDGTPLTYDPNSEMRDVLVTHSGKDRGSKMRLSEARRK
jgi:hypothetical protein